MMKRRRAVYNALESGTLGQSGAAELLGGVVRGRGGRWGGKSVRQDEHDHDEHDDDHHDEHDDEHDDHGHGEGCMDGHEMFEEFDLDEGLFLFFFFFLFSSCYFDCFFLYCLFLFSHIHSPSPTFFFF